MFQLVVNLLVLQILHSTLGISTTRIRRECATPNTITIIGGTHNRLVTEGGRITLTCCMPGVTNGHDHEQLVWQDPHGMELSNHFANPQSKFEHLAYSVPDFRSHNQLVSMLVIQRFRLEDVGVYSCRKANTKSMVDPAKVTLDIRPRLLADYVPIEMAENNGDGTEVVAGPPAFVPLEEDRRGDIACRINPNTSSTDVQITWYFQGRQLIAPSIALGNSETHRPETAYAREEEQLLPNDEELPINLREFGDFASSQKLHPSREHSVSLDPAELGIQLLDRGQVLRIARVGKRHSGVYICKAEATNFPDHSSYENEHAPASILIQLQAIRGIVFTPPRLLPGSPREVHTPPKHETGFNGQSYSFRKRPYWVEKNYAPMMPSARYYMLPGTRNPLMAEKLGGPSATFRSAKPVIKEGGKLVLECEARGNPSPRIIWFRGGVGVSSLDNGNSANFDHNIKQTLEHTSLDEVRPQLGIQITDNGVILNEITSVSSEAETVERQQENPDEPAETIVEGSHSKLGRFGLTVSRRADATGEPVISVSRLTISQLKPWDATRYTCLALLDLSNYGGSGNFTDVGSVFPEVVLHPRFIKSGTHLESSGYPGENATLTCEAFGGLPNSNGLRLRLLRGPDIPRLIKLLTGAKRFTLTDVQTSGQETFRSQNEYDISDQLLFQPGIPDYSTRRIGLSDDGLFELDDVAAYNNRIGNGTVEVVLPNTDERYQLTVKSDPRNPYISILTLRITDLKPEDNAYYACEALSGPQWRAIAPTANEGVGRITVWFAPPAIEVEGMVDEESTYVGQELTDKSKAIVYGLLHLPSKLVCRALGKPNPTWSWTGPLTGSESIVAGKNNFKGFKQKDFTDGEFSVSELLVPAGYSNVGVFGTYSCTASNRLGSATGSIRLKLATHPGRPTMRACKVEAKLIELCVDPPEETGGLPLTHYELRIQTHPRDVFIGPFAYLPGPRLLRLPNLIPGYYYRFALSAVSAAGRGPNAYLQVTTNRLSMPTLKMLTSPDYIEPEAYAVHWQTDGTNRPEIDQYRISVRPVEVDYSMGEVTGRPIGDWSDYTIQSPNCQDLSNGMDNTTTDCQFRVGNLKPDTAYELELSAENSKGFSEAQRIIFRTSSLTGASGQMLNTPSYMRQTTGNSPNPTKSIPHLVFVLGFLLRTCIY